MLSALGKTFARVLRKAPPAATERPAANDARSRAPVRAEDVPGLHRLFPDHPLYGSLLALEVARRGDVAQALAVLDRVESAAGTSLETAVARARVLGEQGDREGAIATLARFAVDAKDPGVHVILAENYFLAGRVEDADRAYATALALNPHSFAALMSKSVTAGRRNRIDEAIECARRALRYDPRSVDAWANLHWIYGLANRFEEEAGALEEAIALFPARAQFTVARGMRRLLHGDFVRGWEDFDTRLRDPQQYPLRPSLLDRPLWRGEPFAGRTLLVFGEQGAGDNLMMARYLPRVKALGGRVVYEVPEALHELLETAGGIDRCVPRSLDREPDVPFDLWVPVMTLPRIFSADLDTIPAEVPYLSVPSDARTFWKGLVGSPDALKVGLAWSGNPGHLNDYFRSVPADALIPLLRAPGVLFHRVQLEGPRDLSRVFPTLRDLTEHVVTFADTAALVEQMDLVVTVDTSIAHLAGALGKPTWLMLPFRPDWRWLLDRDDSPWYPSVRVFRQPQPQDWRAVLEKVKTALGAEVARRAAARAGELQETAR